jgi:hypothetical protein
MSQKRGSIAMGLDEVGVTCSDCAKVDDEPFPAYDLEIWGHAHRDYFDMAPLRAPRPRSTRWQVAMAHGHYEPPETRANPLRPSWIFSDEEIAATGADYLALGHWDRPMRVGNGVVPAFYSGSPERHSLVMGDTENADIRGARQAVPEEHRIRQGRIVVAGQDHDGHPCFGEQLSGTVENSRTQLITLECVAGQQDQICFQSSGGGQHGL